MDKPKWTHRIVSVHESDGMISKNFTGACCILAGPLTENLHIPGYDRVRLRLVDGSNDYGGEYNFSAVQLRKLIEEHSGEPKEEREDDIPSEGDSNEPITIPHEEPLGGGDAEVHTPKE